jgi:phage regulator Rha-like protein/phage antirepressor YoqD-like protein
MNGNIPENTPAVPAVHPLTMTSLEIAELVEVRHDSVRRSIETIAERGAIKLPQIVEVSGDGTRGPRSVRVYILGERDTLVVVAQLSPEFTGRVIDRWRWLEAQFAKPAPVAVDMNNPKVLRAMLMAYADNVEKLEADKETLQVDKGKVEKHCDFLLGVQSGLVKRIDEKITEVHELKHTVDVMAPQVKALRRIALEPADDAPVSLRAAAKNCSVPPKWLVDWMLEHKWLYRGAGEPPGDLIPYQPKITAGYLEMKLVEQVRTSKTNSTVQVVRQFLQPVVTQKGRVRLSYELECLKKQGVDVPNTSIHTPKPRKPATKPRKPPGRGMNPDAPNGLAWADRP